MLMWHHEIFKAKIRGELRQPLEHCNTDPMFKDNDHICIYIYDCELHPNLANVTPTVPPKSGVTYLIMLHLEDSCIM